VGGTNTGLPQQRPVSAGVVQTRRNQCNNLLPLGTELLALAETEPCSSVSAVRFAEFPAPKRALHTPLCGIVSTGEIEQRLRLN